MNLQPGVGYTFTGNGASATLIIDEAWPTFYENTFPFKVTANKVGTDWVVSVKPGTINNIEPTISGTLLSNIPPPTLNIGFSATYVLEYIYLEMPVGGSGSPPPFPDSPIITNYSTFQYNTDSTAYLLLAAVDKASGQVSQYVSGSQWGERYKCGTDDAAYYFGLV